ncbi:aldehyde ferredoxin oxidoreductase family protein [Chloroflexota bacterium]
MSNLYAGTILRVDLSRREVSREPTSSYSKNFLGGRGINTKILYDEVPPEIGPFDPANILIFGAGPLCGTPVSASRTEVTTQSPETGFLASSNFGGYFGPELKFAGYDHIIISGKADKPVYLFIYNDQVEIRDASHLWGKDTYKTQEIVRSELGPEVKVACIGQAGENRVYFATIQHELRHGAGRTGTGSIMGSKNLKAIAVRGTKGITLADALSYLVLVEEFNNAMRADPIVQERQKRGQAYMNDIPDVIASRNMVPKPVISCDLFFKYEPKIKRTGCFGCPSQCMDQYPTAAKGGGAISCTFYHQPVFKVGTKDLDLVLECSFLSIRYGIDIVSSMAIIAWLMELYEKGIIGAKDTDGIPMEWGNKEAILGIFRKMVFREGIGDILADGIIPASNKIGRGTVDYASHMKGLPLYVPFSPAELVSKKGQALSLAISSRGDTMRSGALALQEGFVTQGTALIYPDKDSSGEFLETTRRKSERIGGTTKAFVADEYEGKPEIVAYIEDVVTIVDCLSACKLCSSFNCGRFSEEYQARLFSAGSGIETSTDTLFDFARRIRNIERSYCARAGMTRKMEILPKRYMDRKISYTTVKFENVNDVSYIQQTSSLETSKFEAMKSKYYTLRGWDVATGIPARETLEQTGLKDVARDLKKRGTLPEKSLRSTRLSVKNKAQ